MQANIAEKLVAVDSLEVCVLVDNVTDSLCPRTAPVGAPSPPW